MEKILLVTGASSDVGIKLIQNVYQDYKMIYVQYFNMNDSLEALINRIKENVTVVPIQADFSDDISVDMLLKKIKDIGEFPNSIVHLPAPKVYNKQFHKDKWENYELGWKVSVRSINSILRAFIPDMAKQRYGRIVFMLTSNTVGMPAKYQASYTTVKYALLGLMKSLSVEYIDKGITVNGVSPDMMETKFLSEIPNMIIEKNAENSPLGRNIKVEEIIPVFINLLADSGSAITGQNIAITGGL